MHREHEQATELISEAITGSAMLLAKIVLVLLLLGCVTRAFR